MSANPIIWVAIKQDYNGVPGVMIHRKNDGARSPYYRMTEASQDRVIGQVEKQAAAHRISLGFGSITGKLDLLLHMNLPTRSLI